MNQTRKLTFSALCSALIIALLFVGAYVTTGTLAVYFVCTLLIMVIVTETDRVYGLIAYIVTALIAYFLLPDKNMAVSYAALFGLYGVIKSVAESIRGHVFVWVVKIAFFNLAIAAGYSLIALFTGQAAQKLSLPLLWAAGNVVLVIFDILLSYAITYYKKYIADKLKFLRNK